MKTKKEHSVRIRKVPKKERVQTVYQPKPKSEYKF